MSEGFTLYWDDPYPSQRCKRRAEVQHEDKAFTLHSVQVHVKKKKEKKKPLPDGASFSAVFVGRRLVIGRVQRRLL